MSNTRDTPCIHDMNILIRSDLGEKSTPIKLDSIFYTKLKITDTDGKAVNGYPQVIILTLLQPNVH